MSVASGIVTKEALEALIGRLEFWALIFGILVAIGVAGESVYGVRIWWNNRKLHDAELSENRNLQVQISAANDHAQQANERAETARRDAEALRLQVAQSNERVAQAESKAAQAQLDLARFKAPRELTPEQRDKVSDSLARFRDISVDVVIFGDTPEIVGTASTILDCMSKAGWETHRGFIGQMALTGILVASRPEAGPKAAEASNTLATELTSMGVPAKVVPWEKLKINGPFMMEQSDVNFASTLLVFVGAKAQ